MKIGLNLWVWTSPFNTDRDLPLFGKVKSFGGEVIEFGLEDDVKVDPQVLRRELEAHQLGCSIIGIFSPERDLASMDAACRQRAIDYTLRGLDLAAASGAAIFSGSVAGVGGEQGLSAVQWQECIRRAADELEPLGQYAAKLGVRLGVEILNRYENNLLNTAAQARKLVDLVQSPAVGIHLDSFHMNIEETDMMEAVALAGDRLFHLHGSDSHRGTPGDGHVPWDRLGQALQKINFQGFVVIESFNPAGRLAPLARLWRPLADSQDELARQGLEFLQEILRRKQVE
ncbi:MAG: sugar phosphate isomerase/epimerase family protein [Terriglobia bacterium]